MLWCGLLYLEDGGLFVHNSSCQAIFKRFLWLKKRKEMWENKAKQFSSARSTFIRTKIKPHKLYLKTYREYWFYLNFNPWTNLYHISNKLCFIIYTIQHPEQQGGNLGFWNGCMNRWRWPIPLVHVRSALVAPPSGSLLGSGFYITSHLRLFKWRCPELYLKLLRTFILIQGS